MSGIKIKRSGVNGSPAALAQGELGYSWLAGTDVNGGDRLYLGTGTETAGAAANIEVIGGKYFTSKLSQTPGILTANAAVITDSTNKINILNVDNLTLNGNTLSSTDINGNIILSPNGTGVVDVATSQIINVLNPSANTHAVTLGYLNNTYSGGLNITGDSGTDLVTLSTEILNFAGGIGLTTIVSNNVVTTNLDNTTVFGGSYGTASDTPSFTVDAQGRLTAASQLPISILSTQISNWDVGVENTISGMVTLNTEAGISVTYAAGKLNFNVNDFVLTLGGDLGGSVAITDLASATLTATIQPNSVALGSDTTGNYVSSLVGGTGVSLLNNTGETATPTISIGQDISSSANVVFQDGHFTGSLSVDGDLTVVGNSVTISASTLLVDDPLIRLGANNVTSDILDLGWIGNYFDTTANTAGYAGLFRDATTKEFYIFDQSANPINNIIDRTANTFSLGVMNASTFIGELTGNASTATILQTPRSISISGDVVGMASFNGSSNISIVSTIQPNSVALGPDTTGNYVTSVGITAGTGLVLTGSGEGAVINIAGITANNTVKGVASYDAINFTTISGVVAIATVDGGTY